MVRYFQLIKQVLSSVNRLLPKYEKVIVTSSTGIEANAVEIAKYLAQNSTLQVRFAAEAKFFPYLPKLLPEGRIKFVRRRSIYFYYQLLSSKYIFGTHEIFLTRLSKRQIYTNVWHGVGHKNIKKLRNEKGLNTPATFTVATSEMTRQMFARAFGVSPNSVFISGYPRNDLLLQLQQSKEWININLKETLSGYEKILIWLPTFRKHKNGWVETRGEDINNPFQVRDFDVRRFNNLLREKNALCIVKPHYFSNSEFKNKGLDQILFIDDEWLVSRGITLYHLLPYTDILITDFSSVMIDYTLLNKQVICFSTDFETYKSDGGFYFKEVETMLPTKLLKSQEDFFKHLELVLNAEVDPYEDKRNRIKDLYFKYQDDQSTKRIISHVFGDNL